MTFTRDDRTLLGDSPARVARALAESGRGCDRRQLLRRPGADLAHPASRCARRRPRRRFSAMPNAGWPEQVGGRIMYPANPEYFGEYALAFCEAGARLVGGCCGTTPAAHRRHAPGAGSAIPRAAGPSVSELTMPAEVEEAPGAGRAASPPGAEAGPGEIRRLRWRWTRRAASPPTSCWPGASLLAEAGADVINVADSPMARMRMSPWAVCDLIQRQVGVETTLHFPTRGRNLLRVQGDLLAAHALGIRNVFVVMGDPTAIGDYPDAMDNYDLVPSGLIKLIKQNFNLGLDHAGADIGQPTSFFVGCALNLCPPGPRAGDQEPAPQDQGRGGFPAHPAGLRPAGRRRLLAALHRPARSAGAAAAGRGAAAVQRAPRHLPAQRGAGHLHLGSYSGAHPPRRRRGPLGGRAHRPGADRADEALGAAGFT